MRAVISPKDKAVLNDDQLHTVRRVLRRLRETGKRDEVSIGSARYLDVTFEASFAGGARTMNRLRVVQRSTEHRSTLRGERCVIYLNEKEIFQRGGMESGCSVSRAVSRAVISGDLQSGMLSAPPSSVGHRPISPPHIPHPPHVDFIDVRDDVVIIDGKIALPRYPSPGPLSRRVSGVPG